MAARKTVPTRERLLAAAVAEFADKGIGGARVDAIARRARVNKQLLYHYFGSKEKLFRAVLKHVFLGARTGDAALAQEIEKLEPAAALQYFIEYMCRTTWNGSAFQRIVIEEALHGARHLGMIEEIPRAYAVIIGILESILERGVQAGVFRAGIDPRELYVSLIGMCGVRVTNANTLPISVGIPLNTEEGLRRSQRGVVAFVLAALRS